MLHTFTGADQADAFWAAIGAQGGRLLSPAAASLALRCSFERLYQLVADGELEAWAYRKEADGPAEHYMISVSSLVRCGIRAGRFQKATDLKGLSVTEEEFAVLRREALGGPEDDAGGA